MVNKIIFHAAPAISHLLPHLVHTLYFIPHLPRFGQVISSNFYEGKLITARETKNVRTALKPLKWIHVSGGEMKHPGRVGAHTCIRIRDAGVV